MTAAEVESGIVAGVRVADVKVGERARKDYGDLEKLKASIIEHGLLQPIVLLPDNYLLCGGRRLEAVRQLGWSAVPFVVSANQSDAIQQLKAERDENTCRKDMTPSELVAIGKKLEELKRPEAAQRQGTRTDLTSGPDGPEVDRTDGHGTRAAVAEAVGMSEAIYKRAKRVVEVAEDESADDEVRLTALAAQEAMDAGTISISGAEKKVREAQEAAAAAADSSPVRLPLAQRLEQISEFADTGMTSGQIGAEIGLGEEQIRKLARENGIKITADEVLRGKRRVRIDSTHIVNHAVMTLDGLVSGLALINFDDLDETQMQNWADSLTTSMTALKRFANKIKEKAQ